MDTKETVLVVDDDREIVGAIALALENGINYFDMAAADASPFSAFGNAVLGYRNQVFYQIHFGADYRSGKRDR